MLTLAQTNSLEDLLKNMRAYYEDLARDEMRRYFIAIVAGQVRRILEGARAYNQTTSLPFNCESQAALSKYKAAMCQPVLVGSMQEVKAGNPNALQRAREALLDIEIEDMRPFIHELRNLGVKVYPAWF